MKIGVIGYRRHAGKHIKILKNKYLDAQLVIYHPNYISNNITNVFSDLLLCDCLIISSPTNTHIAYVRNLVENKFAGKVYLEKPGFDSIEESYELEKLQFSSNLDIACFKTSLEAAVSVANDRGRFIKSVAPY